MIHKWPVLDQSFFANYMSIFHKTEIQTVILRCLMCLNLNWIKSYDPACYRQSLVFDIRIIAENFTIQFHTDRQPLFKSPRFITKRNSVTPPSFNCYIRVGTVGCYGLYFVARFIGDPQLMLFPLKYSSDEINPFAG